MRMQCWMKHENAVFLRGKNQTLENFHFSHSIYLGTPLSKESIYTKFESLQQYIGYFGALLVFSHGLVRPSG